MLYINELKPWMFIRTKINNGLWYPNILISIKDRNLIIPILENQISNNVLEHDFIKVSFSIEQIEIKYLCIVEEIIFEKNLKMSLKILKEEFWTNIRKTERIEINSICKIVFKQTMINAYIADISLTGCRIISNEQLEKAITYKIFMYKENTINENFVNLYGNIKRRCINNNKLEYGIQFLNITDKELDEIAIIIEKAHAHTKNTIENLLNKYQS